MSEKDFLPGEALNWAYEEIEVETKKRLAKDPKFPKHARLRAIEAVQERLRTRYYKVLEYLNEPFSTPQKNQVIRKWDFVEWELEKMQRRAQIEALGETLGPAIQALNDLLDE